MHGYTTLKCRVDYNLNEELMKAIKITSFILFTVLFTSIFMPDLSAKRHSSFSFNLNLVPSVTVAPTPRYVEYNYVAQQPATYVVVEPYRPAYVQKVYYQAPQYTTVVKRTYKEKVYVQPHHSYWAY